MNNKSGFTSWISPSNIALVKYWGKKENQIPINPSISFTLKNCNSKTRLLIHNQTKDLIMNSFFMVKKRSRSIRK